MQPGATFSLSARMAPIIRASVWAQVARFMEETGMDEFDLAAYLQTHKMPHGLNGNLLFPGGRPPLWTLMREKAAELGPRRTA